MPNNSAPFEIIAAPFVVWMANLGTAFPAVDVDPAGAGFTKVGTSGDLNYSSEGVTVEHSQSITFFRALGDTGSRKASRQEEDLKIRLTLWDLTLEQYRLALNNNAITTVAAASGIAGNKSIGLSRGDSVHTVALLVRGPSPVMDSGNLQYEIPRAAQTGNPSVVYRRSEPAGLALEWTALVDPNASAPEFRFGKLRAMTAVAL